MFNTCSIVARPRTGVLLCMKVAEFNQRVSQVVAQFNIGGPVSTTPHHISPSHSNPPLPNAVITIARFVLEYLKLHDEKIMLKLKKISNVNPRVIEYMECYALILDKYKVLEKGNKFLVSFALFTSVFFFFGSLLSYSLAGTFNHIYYGIKLIEKQSKKTECAAAAAAASCCCEKDNEPPILFKVAELIRILLGLGYTLIKWFYGNITTLIKWLYDKYWNPTGTNY